MWRGMGLCVAFEARGRVDSSKDACFACSRAPAEVHARTMLI